MVGNSRCDRCLDRDVVDVLIEENIGGQIEEFERVKKKATC